MLNDDYLSLEEIGLFLGTTSHRIGRLLKALGYRTLDGKPSNKAIRVGLAQKRYGHYTTDRYVWAWHKKKIFPILKTVEMRLLVDCGINPTTWKDSLVFTVGG